MPWLLIASALVNLTLTPFLPSMGLPVRSHPDPSLTYLVHDEGISLDRRYGFYMELYDAARGGTLTVPLGSFLSEELIEGSAEMTMLESDYDPSVLPAEAFPTGPPLGLLETPDGDLPYWILSGPAEEWWLAMREGRIVVVPGTVVPGPGTGQ